MLTWYSNGKIKDGLDIAPPWTEPPEFVVAQRMERLRWVMTQPYAAPIKNAAAHLLHELSVSGRTDDI